MAAGLRKMKTVKAFVNLNVLLTLVFFLVLTKPAPLYAYRFVSGNDDQQYSSWGERELITLDMRGADLQDVLSVLAMKMDATVILARDDTKPSKVDLQIKDTTLDRALDLVIESQGLTYLRRGNLIVVGNQESLDKNFFSEMILTRFNTHSVPAGKVLGLIKELNIPVKSITVDANPNAFWVQGPAESLQKVRELVAAVDRTENGTCLQYRTVMPTQISPGRAVELLDKAGIKLNHYIAMNDRLVVFDRELFPRWSEVKKLLGDLDTQGARKETVFLYRTRNITAQEAADKLKLFDFGSGDAVAGSSGGASAGSSASSEGGGAQASGLVKTVVPSYGQFSRELLIICPPYLENEVRSALAGLDTAVAKIKVPVITKSTYASCSAYRDLLSQLTGVPAGDMRISSNLGTESAPEYVLWVETTPDKVKMIKDAINEMKSQ